MRRPRRDKLMSEKLHALGKYSCFGVLFVVKAG